MAFIAAFVLPPAAFASAPALQASGQIIGYYICLLSTSTDGGKTPITYLSDVVPNTGFPPGQITGFRGAPSARQSSPGKLFITRPFPWGNRPRSASLNDDLRAFMMKTSNTSNADQVRCGSDTADQMERVRQNELKAANTSRLQIVEFDWTPPPTGGASPAPAPAAGAAQTYS